MPLDNDHRGVTRTVVAEAQRVKNASPTLYLTLTSGPICPPKIRKRKITFCTSYKRTFRTSRECTPRILSVNQIVFANFLLYTGLLNLLHAKYRLHLVLLPRSLGNTSVLLSFTFHYDKDVPTSTTTIDCGPGSS